MESYQILPRRERNTHKGDYGRLLIIGGSVGYTGAPTLTAKAAVRTGAGLVHLGVPESIYTITAFKNDEAMPFPLKDRDGKLTQDALPMILDWMKKCDVCVLGPGLGRTEELFRLVRAIVRAADKPLVLDADAIFAVSRDLSLLDRAKGAVYLTPHDGEFRHLVGDSRGGDRVSEAAAFAKAHRCTVIRKGRETICASISMSCAPCCCAQPFVTPWDLRECWAPSSARCPTGPTSRRRPSGPTGSPGISAPSGWGNTASPQRISSRPCRSPPEE